MSASYDVIGILPIDPFPNSVNELPYYLREISWVAKLFKTNFQKWRLLHSFWRVPPIEKKMKEFFSVCINEKPASCLKVFSERIQEYVIGEINKNK